MFNMGKPPKNGSSEDPNIVRLENTIAIYKRSRRNDILFGLACIVAVVLTLVFGMTPAQKVFGPSLFTFFSLILFAMAWSDHKNAHKYWEQLEAYRHDHIQSRIDAKGE